MSNAANEIKQLRDLIAEHDHLYYTKSQPRITDQEYDRLFARLKALEAEHPELVTTDSPTQRVGEKPLEGFVHVRHAVPMMSIDNTYTAEEVRRFDLRVAKALDGAPYAYLVDPKIDGVSATLRYEQGRLVLAATRGDGRTGDDITANARTIRAIPLKLRGAKWPDVLEVRGEIYWPREAFDRHNARRASQGLEEFANPRNATSGTLKSLDTRAVAGRGLSFIAHGAGEIEGVRFQRASEFFDAVAQWGVPTSTHRRLCDTIDDVIAFIEQWEEKRHALEYETDGLVIKLDDLAQRDQLGATSRYPRWAIAYKYAAEQGETVLRSVDFQVGKLGTITPRAVMDPVQLSGTTVQHASLHNFDQVDRLGAEHGGLHIGDTVLVEKAGEIIPQVVGRIIKPGGTAGRRRHPTQEMPAMRDVVKDEGGVYMHCINPACPAQLKERLKYFCGRDQMDIDGLGDVLIEKMVDLQWLSTFADIYELPARAAELAKLEFEQQRKSGDATKSGTVTLGEKRAQKIIDGIRKSKSQPLARVLAALNIRHVGGSSAELIANHFGTMEAIATAEEDDLQKVDGVGPEMAASLRTFFSSAAGEQTWKALQKHGVNMTQPDAIRPDADGPLAGKTLVVTGTLERFGRKEIESLIKKLGGKAAGSVSRKTDYLIAGENAGSKLDKANTLGVPVLTEAEFIERFGTGD